MPSPKAWALARIARREREHVRLLTDMERQAREPDAVEPPLSHYIDAYIA